MEITDIRRVPSGSQGNVVAFFDARINGHIVFKNMKLSRGQSGWRAHSPNAFGIPVIAMSATLNEGLVRLALEALGDESHNDRAA